MGLVLPSIIDEALDLIGVNWPNVDEDDYFEMATTMRDFAEKFEGHGGDAHKAVTRILSSSEGWAVDSMQKHWSHVKTGHLEKIPEVARLFATACDGVGNVIRGMKVKAGVELGILAGTVVAALAAAPFTLGISAGVAAVEVAAMREIVRRLVKEAVDHIVEELIAQVTEPVTAKLAELVEDMVLDLAEGAFNPGGDSGGSGGTQLASAGDDGGNAGSGGKKTKIDHTEFEDGAGKVSRHGSDMGGQSSTHIGKSKTTFGRTKGRDPFTESFDNILEGAIDGMEKAAKRVTTHVTDTIPDRVKAASRHQKRKDRDVGDETDKVDVKKVKSEGETPTYLLNADGGAQRLMPDGTARPVNSQDPGIHSVLNNGQAWYEWNHKGETRPRQGKDRPAKGEKVESQKIAPGSTELARATQTARYHNRTHNPGGYDRGANYASALYDDGKGNRFILVGSSGKSHSERVIGLPVLENDKEDNIKSVYTEREPCQKNPKCDAWLARHFNSDVEVSHSVNYDQSSGGRYEQNREHRAYTNWLHGQWDQQGISGGVTDTILDVQRPETKFRP